MINRLKLVLINFNYGFEKKEHLLLLICQLKLKAASR